MKTEKPSVVLAWVSWASVFIEGWLILLRIIPADRLTWIFFAVFFVVAVFASAVASPSKKDGIASADDLIIKVDDKVYQQRDGTLLVGPERKDGKMIVLIQTKEKK